MYLSHTYVPFYLVAFSIWSGILTIRKEKRRKEERRREGRRRGEEGRGGKKNPISTRDRIEKEGKKEEANFPKSYIITYPEMIKRRLIT